MTVSLVGILIFVIVVLVILWLIRGVFGRRP
jgi:hypothetical protein